MKSLYEHFCNLPNRFHLDFEDFLFWEINVFWNKIAFFIILFIICCLVTVGFISIGEILSSKMILKILGVIISLLITAYMGLTFFGIFIALICIFIYFVLLSLLSLFYYLERLFNMIINLIINSNEVFYHFFSPKKCYYCKGFGKKGIDKNEPKTCSICNGSGFLTEVVGIGEPRVERETISYMETVFDGVDIWYGCNLTHDENREKIVEKIIFPYYSHINHTCEKCNGKGTVMVLCYQEIECEHCQGSGIWSKKR